MAKDALHYLGGYPEKTLCQVQRLIDEGRLAEHIASRYEGVHDRTSNKLLFEYVKDFKRHYMRTAPPVSRATYDDRLMVVEHALGLHTFSSKAHGGKLRASSEIRIASVFRKAPEAFLRMIVVHELAHLREKDHSKAFYRMCESMEPEYHQLEFDTRLFLTAKALERSGG
ncbi:MAG: putative metal-dependent hydrolase [Planctomycetota bacterium]|jgi:predicted metal-dependent hydrolase